MKVEKHDVGGWKRVVMGPQLYVAKLSVRVKVDIDDMSRELPTIVARGKQLPKYILRTKRVK